MKRPAALASLLISISSPVALAQVRTLSLEQVIERASPAVVKIVAYDITGAERGQGSGFFIGRGEILTNAHVVKHAYSAEVQSLLRTYDHVTIARRDDKVDLALLRVEDAPEPTISLAGRTDLRPGRRVVAIGNPLGLDRTVSDGLISAVRGIPGELQLIQISAPISPGSSGGPLLDLQGSVIGVTCASLSEGQNLNFAVGIETVKRFLEQEPNPERLKKARSRVLWRAILKWAVKTVVAIIALAFGAGYWIIPLVIMALALLFCVLRGLWRLISAPFRRAREGAAVLPDAPPYMATPQDGHEGAPCRSVEEDDGAVHPTARADCAHCGKAPGIYGVAGEPALCRECYIEHTNLLLAGYRATGPTTQEDPFCFHCWRCGRLVEVPSSIADHVVECGGCGAKLRIPTE